MSSAVDLKSKEEKDAELDKRIEALRKKNEALMKRYQEIEEDRKKAEQEGIAVTTPRKIKQLEDEPSKRRKEKENFSITIGLNSAEKRVVRDRGSPNSSSDAPCSPDQTFPRSPPHRIRGGIGRSPCIERSDIPSWEASGGLGGGVRGERGRRSRGGRSRGSARERIGGGKRGGRFREWEERGEGGELFGEREETVGRFSGRPSSDKEERSSRFCEREEYGGGDDKKVGRFIEQVENDGAREEQGGRSSRWEYKRGRGSHRGGTMSEKEEKGGKGNDLGGSFCEREDWGGGDREGRRGGGVGKLKQGGKSGRGIGGGGVKECGSGSDEWGSGGGDSDEWGIGGAGGDEWVGGNESRECSGRVRGGALDGKGGIVKAKKTGSIAFSEHREESGSMGPSSEGGGVGGPERKVKDWEEKRRQNIEKMNEEMEKIAEYERSQREGVREKNPFRNFLDDPRRCGPIIEIDRKEGSRRHVRNWGGSDFDRLKTGLEREKVPHGRRQSPRNADDMTLSMTGRERAEYMRWKTEREQIDQERLARHRKPTGQWRREWDAEKNESMFKEGSAPVIASDEGNRFDENKRPPKPPTFGDFSAEGKAPSSGKNKGRPRERRPPKAYSMHDNRWEENAAQLEGVAVEKESNVEKQEEIKNATLPDNTEQQDVDDDDQWEDASEDEEEMFGEEEYEEEIVEEEAVVVNEEEEKDELVGLVMEREQKQQEKQTVKVDDAKNVVVKKDDTNKQAQSLPAEPTKNERTPAPKLTIDIPVEATVEKSLESKPLSPFSPDGGHNPVLDWGAEMDNELRTPQSSSEDSPPQADTRTSHRVGSDASESQKNSLSDVFEAPGVNSPEDLTRFSHPQDVREDTEEARCFSHTQKSTEYVKNETECEASDTAQTVETAECERENHPVTGAVQITNFETVCFRKD